MSVSRKARNCVRFVIVAIVAVGAAAAVPDTVILPILSRPNECAYCEVVSESLSHARESVVLLMASLDLENNPLVDALCKASGRGVRVRVLLDRSAWEPEITERNRPAIEFLNTHGVEARFDDPEVTTHAKLVVMDGSTVILGSTNWNHYAFCEHRQADVRIEDPRLAEAFETAFNRMWDEPGTWPDLAFDQEVGGREPELIALPDGGGTTLYGSTLLKLLDSAKRSIHASLYRISIYLDYPDSLSNRLVDALIDAANRGLDVRVLLDDCRFYEDSATANLFSALYLAESGVPVRFDLPEQTTHAKLLILDGETVVLGSTNWNYYSVEQNVEADVALIGLPDVGRAYETYFEWLWSGGREIGG
jgi:phosphatidylserine/phosphatidylglycerophosphate/cardiolipin synthase-like enzyme